MPRSLVGSLLEIFSAAAPDEGRRVAGRGARQRGLYDAQLLPESISPITLDGDRLKHLRVGIVGAGFAGLAAAWYLRECGADVTVFEALDRVGGRVHTDRGFIPGKIVEAGAELIGENHPMWMTLARRFGLGLVELTTDREYADDGLRVRMRFGNRDLTDDEMTEVHDGLLPHLDEIGAEARLIDPVKPWTAPDAQRLDGWSVADKLDGMNLSPLLREAIEFTLGNDACAPVDVQSYLGLLALVSAGRTGDDTEGMRGYWDASEVFRCAQGNQALAERITEMLNAQPNTVRTDTAVTRITITEEIGPARATITTADDSTHEVDYVILAVPAPQWSRIEIVPPLPEGEYEMTHGPAVKYLTAYDDDDMDWPGGGRAPSAKWDELGTTWESTDRQQPAGQPFGLTVFSGGTHVLRDEQEYRHRLAAFFPGIAPLRAQLVDWRETGYSVPTVGQVTTVGQRLSRPHAGHLYFAGEQTSLGFYGYMEGALQSGARIANAIVREVLGSQLPAPAPSGICLPLGHLSAGPLAQRVRSEELARELGRDQGPFGGDRVDQRFFFTAPGGGPVELRTVHAIWPGIVGVERQMVSVEMLPSLRLRLGTLFGEDTPIPVRATYGPVLSTVTGNVGGGAELGTLIGPDFTIRFQDQDGYHLHPLAVFELFERHGLWADTGGARCPLLPPAGEVPPMAVAGEVLAPHGAPYLVISGGSRGWTVHNPPASLDAPHFSFLSNDPVVVEIGNRAGAGSARLTIHDVTDAMYLTTATNPAEVAFDDRYDFVAETVLRPHHLAYGTAQPDPTQPASAAPKPGRRTPGSPLTYRLAVTAPSVGSPLVTTITQDARDLIRQEYRFHGRPFLDAAPLVIPARTQIETATRPYFALHFRAEEFADNNYFPVAKVDGRITTVDPKNSYLMRGSEMFQVAEYLRRRYAHHIERRRAVDPAAIPATVVSPALEVGSNWRNPERNENVNGIRDSNHQLGRAIDIQPVQKMGTPARRALVGCLFAAARDFLQELIDLNGVAEFGDVEIFLEYNAELLWSYRAEPDGTITDGRGGKYRQAWGSPPSIEFAAPNASHVHVAWKPRSSDRPLRLPAAGADPAPPPVPASFRNVILIASEDDSVPVADQLPLNHIAQSLKSYLADVDGQTETEIHVVANAIEWLQRLNAFETPTFRIRRFFSFSHAWPGGLNLEHYLPGTDYETKIHDEGILRRLTEIYDPRPFADTSNVLLPTGTDDLHSLNTNQIRIANLKWLPDEARQRIRRTFADTEGVFIVGSRTAQEEGIPFPPFCAELANVIGQPVRGAAYHSKVFSPGADGEWHERTLTRGDPAPAEQPVVLVPGSYGTFQLAGFWWNYGAPPPIPDFPQTLDLIELYESFLHPVFPTES